MCSAGSQNMSGIMHMKVSVGEGQVCSNMHFNIRLFIKSQNETRVCFSLYPCGDLFLQDCHVNSLIAFVSFTV